MSQICNDEKVNVHNNAITESVASEILSLQKMKASRDYNDKLQCIKKIYSNDETHLDKMIYRLKKEYDQYIGNSLSKYSTVLLLLPPEKLHIEKMELIERIAVEDYNRNKKFLKNMYAEIVKDLQKKIDCLKQYYDEFVDSIGVEYRHTITLNKIKLDEIKSKTKSIFLHNIKEMSSTVYVNEETLDNIKRNLDLKYKVLITSLDEQILNVAPSTEPWLKPLFTKEKPIKTPKIDSESRISQNRPDGSIDSEMMGNVIKQCKQKVFASKNMKSFTKSSQSLKKSTRNLLDTDKRCSVERFPKSSRLNSGQCSNPILDPSIQFLKEFSREMTTQKKKQSCKISVSKNLHNNRLKSVSNNNINQSKAKKVLKNQTSKQMRSSTSLINLNQHKTKKLLKNQSGKQICSNTSLKSVKSGKGYICLTPFLRQVLDRLISRTRKQYNMQIETAKKRNRSSMDLQSSVSNIRNEYCRTIARINNIPNMNRDYAIKYTRALEKTLDHLRRKDPDLKQLLDYLKEILPSK